MKKIHLILMSSLLIVSVIWGYFFIPISAEKVFPEVKI